MMNLTIENKERATEIQNAYNVALECSTIFGFISLMESHLKDAKVGNSGSHIWIADNTGKRIAIIIK